MSCGVRLVDASRQELGKTAKHYQAMIRNKGVLRHASGGVIEYKPEAQLEANPLNVVSSC